MIYPHLDCEGRYSGDPRDIKEDCCPRLPYTLSQILESLHELHASGLITLYIIDNKEYLEASRFDDFQVGLHKEREAKSEIPPNPGLTPEDAGLTPIISPKIPLNLNLKFKSKFKFNSSCPGKIPDEKDIRLTQLLIDLMLQNNPESSIIKRLTEKRQLDWITACRLLRERDEKTEEQIEAVIRWSQTDSFWKSNILSMPTLREKWDQLWMKMRRTTGADNLDGIKAWLKEIEDKNERTK